MQAVFSQGIDYMNERFCQKWLTSTLRTAYLDERGFAQLLLQQERGA